LKKGRIRLKAKNVLPTSSICKQIFVFGLPACMIQVATALLQIVLNNTIVFYGTGSIGSEAALSAMGIVLRISSVVISICVGISIGAQPIIGFNKGAGLHCRVKETIKKAVIAATVVSVGSWMVCEIFPAGILGIFGLHESVYLDFAVRCMRIYLLGMGTAGFQIVASNYYQASGQVVKAMVFSVLRPLILTVPLTLFLPRFFGMDGIFYAGATADLLTAAILAVFITNEFKKQQSVSNYA